MGTYNAFSRVTGRDYPFKIDGDTPTQTEMARINKILAQEEGLSTEAIEKDDGNLFTKNIGRGIDTIQQAYGSAIEGIGESTGLDFLKNYGASVVEENRKELEASQDAARQLDDINNVGSFFDYAGATLGSQVPQLGSTLAGSAAGFLVGGPAGAVVGGLAANLPFFYGSNREAQKEEVAKGNRIEVSEGAAALAALPQSVLDLIADRFLIGGFTGKLVGGGGLFTKGVKAGIKEIGRRGAIGATKGVVTEVPTEIGQQVLERLQAGKSLTNKEAIDEYKEVAAAAALIGGTVRSTGSIVAGSREKKLTKDEELNRDQANEALQTEQQIKNAENFLDNKALPAPTTSTAEVQDDTGVADLETEDNKVIDREKISAAELPFFQKYTKALDAVKKAGKVNPTIVRNAIREEGRKIPKVEVDGIIEEMSKRGEIKPVGKNKFEVMQDDLDTYKARASALKKKADQIIDEKKDIQKSIDEAPPIPAVDADPVTLETNRQRLEQKNLEYDNVVKQALLLEREAAKYIKERYGTTDVKGTTDQRVDVENPAKASSIIQDLTAKRSFDVADKRRLTDNYMSKRDVVMKKLSDRMKAIGLDDVVLRQENIITGNPNESPKEAVQKGQIYEGYFQTEEGKPTIALAMEIYDPNLTDAELESKIGSVLNHEVIHAIKRMGLFTAEEYQTLTNAVSKRKYVIMEDGKPSTRQYTYLDRAIRMNPDLTSEGQIEEAIAEMYRAYADGKIIVAGQPKTLLQKITKFIKSIFGAHEDAGFTDVDQIFENIGTTDQEKQIGRRKRDPESVMERQNSLLNTQASLSDQLTGDVKPKVRPSRTIPQRVKTAYKLFVQRADGQLLPLFVNAADPIPVGQFIEADFPTATFRGRPITGKGPNKKLGTESFYVPTKGAERTKGEAKRDTGTMVSISSEQERQKLIAEGYITEKTGRTELNPYGQVRAVAARPGFHASVKAYALHLGPEDLQVTKEEAKILTDLGMVIKPKEGKLFVKRRAEDQVFAKVSMADDVDYQEQIKDSGRTDINDRVPLGGSYVYTDGQANQDWLVGGDMRIDRVLSRQEAQAIAQSQGVRDLPYKAEVEEILGRKLSSELPADTKFSVKKAVTDDVATDDLLIVTHNIKPEALVRADKLGGIPMPSIAITKASLGFEGFGDISLIGNAKMATPSSVDQIYKRDAYTTRAPRPEMEATDDALKYIENLRDKLESELIQKYDLEPVGETKDALINAFGRNKPPRASLSDYREELTEDIMSLNQDYDPFTFAEIYLDQMTPILRLKYLNDVGAIDKVFQEEFKSPSFLPEEGNELIGRILNAATGFGFDLRNEMQFEYDEKSLRDWLLTERENAIEAVNKPYANKKIPLVLERVADFETGVRKTATLDNIVSIMRKRRGPAQEKGFELALTLGPLAARVTPRFKTLQEIKNSRDRINYKEFDKAKGDVQRAATVSEEALYNFLNNDLMLQRIVRNNPDGYTVDDVVNINGIPKKMLANILEKKSDFRYSISQVITDERKQKFIQRLEEIQRGAIPKPIIDLINETGRRIKAMPTEYFEIKPLRAVKLNEFVGALIPEETSAQVRQLLKRNMPDGKIVEYGESRTEKLMEFKDVMFSRKQLDPKLLNQSIIKNYKTDDNGNILTKAQLGDENPFVRSAPAGTVKLEDALQKLQDERGGAVYDINNAEDREAVSQIIAEEARVAMERDDSAIGWYDRTLKLAKKVIGVAHPEVDKSNPAYNPDNEAAFDFALSITSNGLAIIPNFKLATEQYEHWVENGTFKEEGKDAGMRKAFFAYNTMKETMSDAEITEFLNSDFTMGELKALPIIKELGITVSSTETVNTIVKGSQIFGSKIGGAFYQNVRGNYDALTMDRWFMRFFNRITGNPFKVIGENVLSDNKARLLRAVQTAEAQRNNFLINAIEDAKDEANLDIINDATAIELAAALDRQYQVAFSKTPVELREQKTELDLAAQSLNRNANTQVVETPRSGGDRAMMRLVINRARQILAENGINISNADIQALLWYAEKDLLDAYGVRKGQGLKNDYVDGAIAVLRERGIENETITEALPQSERNRLDSDTNTERKIEGVYNPNDIVTEEKADTEQEVEEYDVSEGLTEQEKLEQQKLQDEFDKFNRVMSAAVNPNKLINVPLADPTESIFGNRYFYGTVKGPQGRMTNVVLTEGFHEYKGTDQAGNPIYSGEGLAHILGERGRKPSRRDELLVPTEEGNWIKYKDVETAIYETLKAYKYKNGVRQKFDGKSTDLVLLWDKARIAGKNKANKTLALVLKYKKDTYSQPVYVVNTTFLEESDRRLGTQRVNSVATMPTSDTTPQSNQIVEDIEKKRLNIQYNNLAPVLGRIVSKVTFGKIEKEKAQKEAEKILIKFQDALLPVGAMLDELKKKGFTIADALDTYMQEELFHGVAGAKVEKIQKELFEPLADTIKTINISEPKLNELKGISNFYIRASERYIDKRLAVADAILYARHAKERNDYINKNKAGDKTKGSGMANSEADAIIKWLSTLDSTEGGKLAKIENISRQIIQSTNRQRLDSGLISKDLLDNNFNSKVYKYYVPLRGDIESEVETQEDLMGKTRMTTNLFGAAGKEDRSALGQTDYAENIIASMMAQNQRSIDRGERNKVGRSFLNLMRGMEEQPDGTFAINDQLREHMSKIAVFLDDMPKQARDALDPNTILTLKENGAEVKVHFKDQRIGRAMKGHMTPESMGKFTKALGKMNKYLSSINTTYNPSFVIPNFARDLQAAGVNMQQYDQKGMTKEVLTSALPAVKGIVAVLRGGQETFWSKEYNKFVEAGGKNATNQMGDLQDQINNIGDILGDISDTGIKKKLGLNKNGFTRNLLKILDDYNTAVENGVRVATFTSLVKRGVTPARAAQAARNVTVNFAKGGENKTLMNSWYLFYNASLQGSMALINAAAKSKKVRKVWGGLVIYGIMQDQINSLLSGDEDEDGIKDYDELPRYVLEHNLILPTFGLADDKFIMIPLSYGLNLAVNFGRSLSRSARGEYTAGEASRSIFGTAFESISPFGGFDNIYNLTAPTVLDPFVSLAINEDYKGDPIYKESPTFSSRPTPDSQAYWSNTSSIAKGIADSINSITGGDAVESGYIDFSPNTLEFWFDYFAGGTGAFVQRSFEAPVAIYDALQGDFEGDIMRAVPLVRKVVISPSEREDVGNYLENRQDLYTILARIDLAKKSGDGSTVRSLFTEYRDQLRIAGRIKAIDNARNRLLRQIKEIEANPRIPEKTKLNLKRIRRQKINDLMKQGLILMRSAGFKKAG
tara:strand:- start:4527 stop:14360 length:9834 start_codon:yes stop_codon:yes gene_type:complete